VNRVMQRNQAGQSSKSGARSHAATNSTSSAASTARYGIDFVDRSPLGASRLASQSTASRPNGLPGGLKSGIESLSGMDLSDVQVHRDSPKPAYINALAYAQGNEIHLAPGHERHLPHEAWHIVQQRQGRVHTNFQAKGAAINDDPALEREADVMGKRAISTTAAVPTPSVVSPRSPVVSGPIQRKVGFEFEDNTWRPWYRTVAAPTPWYRRANPTFLNPAARKAVLHQGTGYNLEADDTPGPNASNLEFVTEPFDATRQGRDRLRTTLTEIRDLVRNRLNPLAGTKAGPAPDAVPPHAFEAGRYVGPSRHRLTGPAYQNGQNLYLSGGAANGDFKIQATAGVGLADIPVMMQYLGGAQVGETVLEKAQRDPARVAMVGSLGAAATNQILSTIGAVPAVAQVALANIAASAGLNVHEQAAFPPTAAELVGFLSALILTMKMLQRPDSNVVKYRIPLMFRTDFALMFAALPRPQRVILAAHPDVLVDSVVAASNAHPLVRLQTVVVDTGLTRNSPLIRAFGRARNTPTVPTRYEVFAGLTIDQWIRGMTLGTDYLTPQGLAALPGLNPLDLPNMTPMLESFGTINAIERAPRGGRKLAVFENRGIAPGGSGYLARTLPINEVLNLAWNQFLFYYQIELSHRLGRPVGAYRQEAPF